MVFQASDRAKQAANTSIKVASLQVHLCPDAQAECPHAGIPFLVGGLFPGSGEPASDIRVELIGSAGGD